MQHEILSLNFKVLAKIRAALHTETVMLTGIRYHSSMIDAWINRCSVWKRLRIALAAAVSAYLFVPAVYVLSEMLSDFSVRGLDAKIARGIVFAAIGGALFADYFGKNDRSGLPSAFKGTFALIVTVGLFISIYEHITFPALDETDDLAWLDGPSSPLAGLGVAIGLFPMWLIFTLYTHLFELLVLYGTKRLRRSGA